MNCSKSIVSNDSIKIFFCQNDLAYGTGVSKTGALKQMPFRTDSLKVQALSNVNSNSDEFGFRVIDNNDDYEHSKNFNFGIDVSTTLTFLNGSIGCNASSDKSLKSDVVAINAYRKIVKTESAIDLCNKLELSDEARKILEESTKKFHDCYGHYFVYGLVKGGALSINGSISTDSMEKKSQVVSSLTANGQHLVVKGGIKNEIELKKQHLSIHALNECTSKSIGLTKIVQNRDFNKMMSELETLDENITDGCVIYYVLYKYEMCETYNTILNKKTKWQFMLESFENVALDIQRDNLDLYKIIIQNIIKPTVDGELQPDDLVKQKGQLIDVEIKMNQLMELNNIRSIDKRLVDCSNYIKTDNIQLAVEQMGVYGNIEFLQNLVKTVLSDMANQVSNIDKIIEFAVNMKSSCQAALLFMTLFEYVSRSESVSNAMFIQLGFEIKNQMESRPDLSSFSNYLFARLGDGFSSTIKNLVWQPFIRIFNLHLKVYLLTTNDGKSCYASHDSNESDESLWLFETSDKGKTFFIRNKSHKRYLNIANHTYDSTDSGNHVEHKCLSITIDPKTSWAIDIDSKNGNRFRLFDSHNQDHLFVECSVLNKPRIYVCSAADSNTETISPLVFFSFKTFV